MYVIKAGDVVIHDGIINDKDYAAISGTMKTEFNRAGTLSFTVPSNNYAYKNNLIKKLSTIIRVYDKYGRLKWKGRVLDTSKDFYGRMTYNCEGWLSILNDSVVRPQGDKDKGISMAPAAMFSMLINQHNEQVVSDASDAKKLSVHVGGFSSRAVTFPYPGYESTLDYIQSNFLSNEDVGGRIWINEKDIYYYSDSYLIRNSTQSIVFGSNLLDLIDTRDASEIYTVILPEDKDGNLLSKNPGYDTIPDKDHETDATRAFGRIVHHESFSDVSGVSALRTKAEDMLDRHIKESLSIEATAFDLGLANSDAGSIEVGTFGEVFSPPHGLSQGYICTAAEIDLCNPANSKYMFGTNPDTLTTKQLKLTRKMTARSQYTDNIEQIDMSYSVFENAVEVNNITFYRTTESVYLSFAVKFLKEVPDNRASILTFNNKYAPSEIIDIDNGAHDETTEVDYALRITTDGKIQVFNNSEIAVNDIVIGNATWRYSS